ncbi:MAG: DUF695 domain-containing protein [Chitinispirillaceae bacterium]|nr:DUF695 domain-containing protein [Chitinispirillaceae bacterium]
MPKIQDQWSINSGTHNGLPMIIRKNSGVKEIAGKGYLNYRSGISFNLTLRTENGLQSKKEEPIISRIEDDLFTLFNDNATCALVMVISSDNFKEYVLYHDNTIGFDEKMGEMRNKFIEYEFTSYTDDDEKWNVFSQF